jgi:hypothetical protein
MNAIFFDSPAGDHERRTKVYDGQLFAYAASPAGTAFCEFARSLLEEAFAPLQPCVAQHSLPVERYVDILAALKPRFIHHPRSKDLIRGLLEERGCDLERTCFDVPRMRSATAGDYLTSGIAYAFHPHRDTWYSAPMCQINWWLPIYPIESENAMAFHPAYWGRAIKNGSSEYNYYQWNKDSRRNAARHVTSDTRKQPKAEEPFDASPQLRVVCRPGGLLLFSAAHMHSTVPNTTGVTRFSIDFRTVHLDDVAQRRGAENVDSACTGTVLRDFLRGSDLSRIPEDLVALYDDDSARDGELVFQP